MVNMAEIKVEGGNWTEGPNGVGWFKRVESPLFYADWRYTIYPLKDYPDALRGVTRIAVYDGYAEIYSMNRNPNDSYIGFIYTPWIRRGFTDNFKTIVSGGGWKKLSMESNFIDFLWNPYYAPIDIHIDNYNWFRAHYTYEVDKSRLENDKPIRGLMGLRMIDGQLCLLSRKRFTSTIPLTFIRLNVD